MSFVSRVTKRTPPERPRSTASSVSDIDFRIIDSENNFHFETLDFVRLGSAHAVEQGNNREDLARVLAVYVELIEQKYEPDRPRSEIAFVEKF